MLSQAYAKMQTGRKGAPLAARLYLFDRVIADAGHWPEPNRRR